mmetsp:Transcript_49327/g.101793  ORF Transcript_49327/g.101793 Transcript_49327/m.101793 type:complete len:414 (+) Transcript_49327:202-1443(+)|eukprot:CAMPEP_0201198250 /NCGR_PEP_ID=MMETSP0851-20130426/156381_1 /ASSEMBLY_ACC=CAM_ASM_000631 /TAXON_ID=183588 /ORGANISM="Pseudo-nitzschia fraudulenta, Strain WWA7" /LENGTH=413 /DNA_ID=CAMNT_0047485487 /DNA_START=202 /DNA_END=1443 /DNA_ORIENTATION=-
MKKTLKKKKAIVDCTDVEKQQEIKRGDQTDHMVGANAQVGALHRESTVASASQQPEVAPNLEELLSSIYDLDTNERNVDNLILNIDDVIHRLINEGKLPGNGSGKISDFQEMTLRNNTAELLRNLSVLRARRFAEPRVSGSNYFEKGSITSPHTFLPGKSQLSQLLESKNSLKQAASSSARRPEKDSRNSLLTSSSSRLERSSNRNEQQNVSNLAQIRARRNEAAMRIKQQTHKITYLNNDVLSSSTPDHKVQSKTKQFHPFGSAANNGLRKSGELRRLRVPPRPEGTASGLGWKHKTFSADKGHFKAKKIPIVQPSTSDIDMQEWEKIELKKLPLILNPSKTERGESLDGYEDYYASPVRSNVYDTDDNCTSYSDDEETTGGESLGSTSDSQRLKHIASMIDELRSRRQNQR